MAKNLIESIGDLLTPDLIGKAASFLGENETGVTKALSGMAPAVLQGILGKAGSDGGTGILDMAKQAAGTGILDNLGGLLSGGNSNLLSMGANLVSGLFGNKTNGLVDTLASFAGIKSSSSRSLMSTLAPIALGLIGKHVMSNGLNASGLLSWLTGQKDSIHKAVPAGLNLSSFFDDAGDRVRETVRTASAVREPEPSSGMPKWLLPLLLLLLGALALWYFLKGCGTSAPEAPVVDTATVQAVPVPEVVEVVRESLKVKLPNGVELDAYKGGIEDLLVAFLNDPNVQPGKDNWFDFNDLNFSFGTADIIPESRKEVDNIVQILKAYPKVKVKIGGYTDKVGDEAANKKLSGDRAAAVAAALKEAGVGGQVDSAEGYGSEFAKFPADAPETDRIKDRRVSLSVRAK